MGGVLGRVQVEQHEAGLLPGGAEQQRHPVVGFGQVDGHAPLRLGGLHQPLLVQHLPGEQDSAAHQRQQHQKRRPSAAQNGFHPPLCIPDSSFAGVTERMAPPPADYTKTRAVRKSHTKIKFIHFASKMKPQNKLKQKACQRRETMIQFFYHAQTNGTVHHTGTE